MKYSDSFKKLLDIATEINDSYVGYGNPNAKILIIANEPGYINNYIKTIDYDKNLDQWKENISYGTCIHDVKPMFNESDELIKQLFNPLHPYKGQKYVKAVFKGNECPINYKARPTSQSFKQYQKLVDFILNNNRCEKTRNSDLDFFESSFIMDFSSVFGKSSKSINRDKRDDSIRNRLPLFNSDFVQNFPIIIVASGHYIREISLLNDLTKVFVGFDRQLIKQKELTGGWANIHYRIDGKGILIHAKHFSRVSDDYLRAIANSCRKFL